MGAGGACNDSRSSSKESRHFLALDIEEVFFDATLIKKHYQGSGSLPLDGWESDEVA
jgi:hypothetical protein